MRDRAVEQFVEYMDQPERYRRWDLVTDAELDIIRMEVARIQADFEYAASNYFWITNKGGRETLFELWPSQELLLDAVRDSIERGLPQKFYIIKARQLGFSLLIDLLGLWKTVFFKNMTGLIVSATPEDAAYLFQSYYLYTLDRLPWWLQPMEASREIKNGIVFDNPDAAKRFANPGNNSRITVQGANRMTGVGQGYRLNFTHASEMSDWDERKARQIIEGDMGNAIPEDVSAMAFIETTGKGAGTYAHDFWRRCVSRGINATWRPKFFPWFMEAKRRRTPEKNWQLPKEEEAMSARVAQEWLKCSACGRYYENLPESLQRLGGPCPRCAIGKLEACQLTKEQLCWMWQRRTDADQDLESLRELKQELCTTPEESFQQTGNPVFPQKVQEFVNSCVRRNPLAIGLYDKQGRLHYPDPGKKGRCGLPWCNAMHEYEQRFVTVYEFPRDGYRYMIGVDPSEGNGGNGDYGVAFVNRVGKYLREPDEQVALFRANTFSPRDLAYQAAYLGRMYNSAEIAVEVNRLDSCLTTLRYEISYPNLWRWKIYDALNPLTNKIGWVTQDNTKQRLWLKALDWLRSGSWIVRSSDFAEEMKVFRKEFNSNRVGASGKNEHDDTIMAGLICLFCAHDTDYDPDALPPPPAAAPLDPSSSPWKAICQACGESRGVQTPVDLFKCPACKSIRLTFAKNGAAVAPSFSQIDDETLLERKSQLTYDQL